MKKTVGVLALQGAFARHIDALKNVGAKGKEIREPGSLAGIDALIIPGGESTTMSKMLVRWKLIEPVQKLIQSGMPVYGTCAGLILLADHLVEWDELPRFRGLHVTVNRNAYGRQIDSFEAALELNLPGMTEFTESLFEGIFIRAPKVVPDSIGKDVEILCRFESIPVLLRQGNILAGSFHPELSGNNDIHHWFVNYF